MWILVRVVVRRAKIHREVNVDAGVGWLGWNSQV